MKKLLSLLSMIAIALVCALSVSAEEAEQTQYIFWDEEPYVENETTKIIDHVVYRLCNEGGETHYDVYDWFDTWEAANTVEEITVVPEIDGIKVTHINCWASSFDYEHESSGHRYWKNHNYKVKKINFPDTLESIGGNILSIFESVEELVIPADGTCENMESLREVTYTEEISHLGGFKNCTKLEKINYTGTIETIGFEAFRNCISLTDFEIPETVKTIYDAAFRGSGITSATIPANTYLYDYDYGYTFADCVNLTEVTFGGEYDKSLTVVYACFKGCTSLKKVTFPDAVNALIVDSQAFYGCIFLEEIVFPETCGILYTEQKVFKDCSSLKKVVLPKICGSIYIGRSSFKDCKALETLTFPNKSGNIDINQEAFRGCTALTALTLTKFDCGVIVIRDDAFRSCTSLKTITFPYPGTPYIEEMYSGGIIIGYRAFRDCTALTTVKRTRNIEKIYGGAFRGCSSLKSFTVSDELKFVGKNAFYGCKNLKTVTMNISETTPKIYSNAFCGTASNLKFTTLSNTSAKSLRTVLVKSGLKNVKVAYKASV